MKTVSINDAAGVGAPAAGQKNGTELVFLNSSIQSTKNSVNKQSGGIPVLDDHGVIGYVRGTVFHRKMYGSRHLLRNPHALAFGTKALKDAIRQGATTVLVEDREDGKRYETPINAFFEKGFLVDRGFGQQCGLELVHWEISDPARPEKQLSLLETQRTPLNATKGASYDRKSG